ncbi:NrfD/PsrC family molybdoenzyme membrane anchor subunit [Magnetospirillum moscoviense]|uniref:Molybdopterin oxidoreductase n=1 Tax=Magnetospirillum moscoviense TaxID=1437059 RepID=A0A178M4T6_9PROT|nr:NrfD/PsrC family molybdoenzyme membrane anchor subunit [Magnetospirillum moscoviense]MBF0324209.1 polysulfide reductase NrfD [Alphaproteobacteria bacterium]OAN43760.1 molybdopterin oxidoreductase [Magnetospirillum moscoviense]
MKRITFRELTPMTTGWLALMGALLVVAAIAGAAVLYMEHQGHWVTGMTNQVVWGTPHVFAIFLIVAASGALNVASIGSVFGREPYQPLGRLSGLLAIALLAGGLAVLVLDLGRPDRLIVAMTHFNFKSIFAWNVILYSGFFAIVGAYLWTMMDWKMKGYYKGAAVTAFVWRLVLTTGTGSIFGFLMARDAYNSAVMAPLFIAMSFAFGLAAFILVVMGAYAGSGRPVAPELVTRMGRLLGLFCAANLYFVAVQHLTALYMADRGAVEAFILADGGIYTLLFWGVQVALGGLVPMAILFSKNATRCTVRFAAILVMIGGFAQVYVILIGGQAFPLNLFPGMEVSSSFQDGVVGTYAPSLPEVLLGIGGFAVAGLITLVGATFLRILPDSLAAD